jgi:hypothetical protein
VGYVGWSTVADQANTETGAAARTSAQVTAALAVGAGVGGSSVVNTYSGLSPIPPEVDNLLLENGDDLLLESGDFILLE